MKTLLEITEAVGNWKEGILTMMGFLQVGIGQLVLLDKENAEAPKIAQKCALDIEDVASHLFKLSENIQRFANIIIEEQGETK